MKKLFLHCREWLADHSGAQYPKPKLRPVLKPTPEFRFSDFVIAMKGLTLAAVCLLVAIPLLGLCFLMFWSVGIAIFHR
ncbi:hypothetical protein G3N95_30100 [Paraburkholderia sp. Tr-20389]|uniref:hypothetical protein n=1 Tax=Paraburkholderia sp. Tr-20389 TaxID=2703903 RepID=UPI00197D751D|nr:hypothetical protein [Paraburkholderia sp. Tr-20389]MBN3757228.1 hypothetical protein [Paraburkholderia sp. Tr-20389]